MLDGKYGEIVLLDYVFDELITLVASRSRNAKLAKHIGRIILQDSKEYMTMLFCSESEFQNAWDLFNQQNAKNKFLSFTDCVIISTANSLVNSWVATLDQYFLNWVRIIPHIA
jgi:predicted nucleic acid-binding protein